MTVDWSVSDIGIVFRSVSYTGETGGMVDGSWSRWSVRMLEHRSRNTTSSSRSRRSIGMLKYRRRRMASGPTCIWSKGMPRHHSNSSSARTLCRKLAAGIKGVGSATLALLLGRNTGIVVTLEVYSPNGD